MVHRMGQVIAFGMAQHHACHCVEETGIHGPMIALGIRSEANDLKGWLCDRADSIWVALNG